MRKHSVVVSFAYLCRMTKLTPTQLKQASVVSSASLYQNVNIHNYYID